MTSRRQWGIYWQSLGPDERARINAEIPAAIQAGIARGGPLCCGTTGIWHLPWCLVGPWEPEPEDLQ